MGGEMDWQWQSAHYADVYELAHKLVDGASGADIQHGPVTLYVTWTDADATGPRSDVLGVRRRNVKVSVAAVTPPVDSGPEYTARVIQAVGRIEGWAESRYQKGSDVPLDRSNLGHRLGELLEDANERMHGLGIG